MKNIFKTLMRVFTPTPKLNVDLQIWAQTEYRKDWQYAYQHMIDHNGAAPTRNDNLQGWV